jgi:hypothetical protein
MTISIPIRLNYCDMDGCQDPGLPRRGCIGWPNKNYDSTIDELIVQFVRSTIQSKVPYANLVG